MAWLPCSVGKTFCLSNIHSISFGYRKEYLAKWKLRLNVINLTNLICTISLVLLQPNLACKMFFQGTTSFPCCPFCTTSLASLIKHCSVAVSNQIIDWLLTKFHRKFWISNRSHPLSGELCSEIGKWIIRFRGNLDLEIPCIQFVLGCRATSRKCNHFQARSQAYTVSFTHDNRANQSHSLP